MRSKWLSSFLSVRVIRNSCIRALKSLWNSYDTVPSHRSSHCRKFKYTCKFDRRYWLGNRSISLFKFLNNCSVYCLEDLFCVYASIPICGQYVAYVCTVPTCTDSKHILQTMFFHSRISSHCISTRTYSKARYVHPSLPTTTLFS